MKKFSALILDHVEWLKTHRDYSPTYSCNCEFYTARCDRDECTDDDLRGLSADVKQTFHLLSDLAAETLSSFPKRPIDVDVDVLDALTSGHKSKRACK